MQGRSRDIAIRTLTLAIVFLPVLLTFWFVRAFAVELPSMDDWDIFGRQVPYLTTGRFAWSDVNVQLNESIILFPQVVYLAVGRLAGYRILPSIYISYGFLCGALLMLFPFFRLLQLPGRWSGLWFLPVSVFFLSWRPSDALLWSTDLVNTMALFFSLLALYCCVYCYRSRALFAAAIASGWVASFCMSSGLLVWPLGLFCLAAPKFRLKYLIWWAGSGAVCGLGFVLNLARYTVDWPTGIGFVLANPGQAVHYCLNYLGTGFSSDERAVYFGAAFVLITAVSLYLTLVKAPRQDGSRAALVLIAFVAMALGLLLTRRLGLGPEQALSSRYVALEALAPIGIYYCLLASMQRTPVARYLLGAMLALFLLGAVNSYSKGLQQGRAQRADDTGCAAIVRDYRHHAMADLECAYPEPEKILDRVILLERRHWSLFR